MFTSSVWGIGHCSDKPSVIKIVSLSHVRHIVKIVCNGMKAELLTGLDGRVCVYLLSNLIPPGLSLQLQGMRWRKAGGHCGLAALQLLHD